MVLRLFAIPMATRAADRHDALRAVIVAAHAAALVGFAVLGFMPRPLPLPRSMRWRRPPTCRCSCCPMSMRCAALAPHRRAYGPVRLWGSAAFIVATLGAGALLDVIAARDLIWLIVGAMASARPRPGRCRRSARAGDRRGRNAAGRALLLRDPSFLAVAAAASLIQASHALYYSFSTIDWQAAGLAAAPSACCGRWACWRRSSLFAFSARLPAAFTPSVLILIGAARRARALDARWRSARRRAVAAAAMPARAVIRRDASRHARLHRARRARRACRHRAGLSRGLMGVAMAAGDGLVGPALRRVSAAAAYGAMALIAPAGRCGCARGASRRRTRRSRRMVYRQVGYIAASSRPVRYFISRREAAAPLRASSSRARDRRPSAVACRRGW